MVGLKLRKPFCIYWAGMGAFRTPCASLEWSLLGHKPAFARPSLHLKFPFPAWAETGSMTGVVGHQFEPNYLHHPALANRTFPVER